MKGKRLFRLSEKFRQNISGLYAEKGVQWLENLPFLVADISEKWTLAIENPFPDLSYNYVAPCVCVDGRKAVLKIGFTEKDSIVNGEAKFLKLLDGNGAVKLLRFDRTRCALLLERLMPGENLKRICRIDDEHATRIAVEVLQKIRRKPPKTGEFPTLESWTKSFRKAAPVKFDGDLMKKAQGYFSELSASSAEQLLLHGDFHHQNILSARREPFLAIDPKGIVGDIGFEIAVFLNNPRGWLLSHPNRKRILERRIEIFAEAFALEPQNLRNWAFAEAVLSAWWTIEDGGTDVEKWLACAEIWET